MNVGVGAVGILLARAFVDESTDPAQRRFDLPGQLLFIAGVGTLTYALIEGPHTGWLSPLILGLLIGSGVIAVAFVLAELHSPDPMMDVRVFHDPVYSAAIFTLFAILFSVYGMLLVITQYFQNIRDFSPERAGVVMLAFTVPTIILSPISGGIAARAGGRRPTLIGLCLLIVGLVVIAAGVGGPIVVVLIGLVLVGTAGGLALAPTTNVAMSSIPPDRAGMASGIMSAQRALGSTAGFAIMGSVLAAVVGATLPGKFAPFLEEPGRQRAVEIVVDDANPRAVASIIGPSRPLPDAVAARSELIDAADDAFVVGIRVALLVGGGLTVAALIAGAIAFPKGTREEDDEDAEATTLRVKEEVT